MKKIAIYPGTFDPITHGHIDLIQRATRLFDKVVIAVASSAGKSPLFSLSQRVGMIEKVFLKNVSNIDVISYDSLLVDFMQEKNISFIIRGIRSTIDLEHEFQLAEMNTRMKPDIETVFIKANPAFEHISSTIVREIAKMTTEGSLGDLSLFVPNVVIEALNVVKDH